MITVTISQTMMSKTRNAGGTPPPPPFDPDAQAVIAAIESTGVTLTTTEKDACNQLIVDLKGYGIWTKMKAVYGFLGGTAAAHKFNWKDPQDLDAAFRLVFNGGWTHSANGAQGNGINGYADTKLSPSTYLLQNNNSHSIYSRNIPGPSSFGYSGVGTPNWFIHGRNNLNLEIYQNSASASSASGNYTSLITGTRTASNVNKIYRAGVTSGTFATISQSLPSNNYWLGGTNNGNAYSFGYNAQMAFASLGEGLNDTEASDFYTAVQAFQTTLGRQV